MGKRFSSDENNVNSAEMNTTSTSQWCFWLKTKQNKCLAYYPKEIPYTEKYNTLIIT